MESLPSVYFLSGCRAGTTFEYRVLQKQEQLALYGATSTVQQNLSYNEETLREAFSSDLLYLYRVAYNPLVDELICGARARDIPMVFGVDDLVFDPKVTNDPVRDMPPERAAHYYEGSWRYLQTLLACDAVVAATGYLAEQARARGKRAFVHRNGLSQWMIEEAERLAREQPPRAADDEVIIGYGSGTPTHRQDLAEVAGPLAELMSRHAKVQLHLAGALHIDEAAALPEALAPFGERIRFLPQVPWRDWLAVQRTFDVNLAPLECGNPFCDAKSEIKYTEAAVVGVPTVASRTGAFELAIRDGKNGFLADSADEWLEKLERLVSDRAFRREMGQAAQADVMARYTPQVLGQQLLHTMERIRELYGPQETEPADPVPEGESAPLILNWIVTEPTPGSGGHTDIVRMMNLLASFGHQINAYIVPRQRLVDKSDLEIRNYVRRHFADVDGFVFKWGGPMAASDAVILTHWTTAYELPDTRTTSKVFYFVQDWEPFFRPMGTDYLRAEQTYKMGFSCITLGSWLTEFLRQQYGAEADFFDLAVDHEIYYPREVAKPDRPRICFYARPSTPRRLFPMGVEALALVHQQRPDAEIVFYGTRDEDLYAYAIPFPYTNKGILKEEELAELFSECELGLVLSSTNCSLVPPEMMACRCAVVDLNRDTVRGVLEHEVNALLAEPTPQAIAGAVLRLLDDEPLRQRLIDSAYQQVQQRSWAKSARRVEEILYAKLPGSRRALLSHRSETRLILPALADLPVQQREHLETIYRRRRRIGARLKARAKNPLRRFLQRGLALSGSPVRTLGELRTRRRVGQQFVARCDNLHRVDVLVSTYGRRNTRDLIFHLRESPQAESDLATVRINASLLPDNSYASFQFEPQAGSRGKSYVFYLESPDSVPGDAITLWAYEQPSLPDGKLYRNDSVERGQLVFGTYYDDRWGQMGERPFSHAFERRMTLWDRFKKAVRLLSSRDLSALRWELANYLVWKLGG